MADDLLQTLTRFHREVMVPEMERIVDDRVGSFREEVRRSFDGVNSHFDAIYARFDRLEQEFTALAAAFGRSSGGYPQLKSASPRWRPPCSATP